VAPSLLWALLYLLAGGGAMALSGWGYARWRRQRQQAQFGDTTGFAQTLNHTYHQLAASVADRQSLLQLFTQELPTTLQLERAVLLLVEGQRLVSTQGLTLPINHLAVRQVAASGEATPVQGDLQRVLAQGRTDLGWSCVWVPLMRGANLYGLWVLGQRQGGYGYSADHCRWLTTLARHAALILETVQVAEAEQARADQLRLLYYQAVTAAESERSRLARELHDGVLQDLCALARDLKAARGAGPPQTGQRHALTAVADESIAALRAICHNLRPPLLTNNLPLALQALIERLNRQSTAMISFKSSADPLVLAEESILVIYRIAQEALTNAIHHAHASEILVRLTHYPDALRLTVSDDGCGLPDAEPRKTMQQAVAGGHFGLAGMHERATMIGATLEVQSARDYGTAIILTVPLPPHQPQSDL